MTRENKVGLNLLFFFSSKFYHNFFSFSFPPSFIIILIIPDIPDLDNSTKM